jgi:hypothetical protein
MLFGQCFVWVTDCYAATFVLSYNGAYPVVLCLQMRLMSWNVDIVHCPDVKLVDADYWSRLSVDKAYDPLLQDYLALTIKKHSNNPTPTNLPPRPKNKPYYRSPQIQKTKMTAPSPDDLHIQLLLTKLVISNRIGNAALSNVPVRFWTLGDMPPSLKVEAQVLFISELACYARQTLQFEWAVYSFSNGKFSSSIMT